MTYLHPRLQSHSTQSYKLEKPQIHFHDRDDYQSPVEFQPSLVYKHHAMDMSAKDSAESDAEGAKGSIQHPYTWETKYLPYPTHMFMPSDPIKPPGVEKRKATWVDSRKALAEMVEELKTAKEIAVDLEHHFFHSYYGFTCLMQISTRHKDWLIDTLVPDVRQEMQTNKLGGIFADPNIVKVR